MRLRMMLFLRWMVGCDDVRLTWVCTMLEVELFP